MTLTPLRDNKHIQIRNADMLLKCIRAMSHENEDD